MEATGCAGCGSCCDPVIIDFGLWTRVMATARRYGADDVAPGDSWADHLFIAANMRPVGSRFGDVLLECRFYDREHQACGAYDSRPPLCRGYPWYGREPSAGSVVLNRQCSFWADIPAAERPADARPLIPLTVVTGERRAAA